MKTISIDKQYFDCCSLVATEHVANSLGQPLELPYAIADLLEGDYSEEEIETNLLQLFHLMKGCKYELAVRDNTYNHETDLDQFFIFTVYAPEGSRDWIWQRDCFVLIEMGYPGDPRYTSYRTAQIYDLSDSTLGDCGFFDMMIGWFAQYLVDGEISQERDPFIENLCERISTGYSNNPTYELREICNQDPVWDDNLEGYTAKVKDSEKTLVFFPCEPIYG